MIKIKDLITTPSLEYHIRHGLSLYENVYRYSSDSFIQLFSEARQALRDGLIQLNEEDTQLLESTDIGEYAMYEGQKVPLDLPMVDESYDYDEVAQSEFGIDYDQLGPGEKEWVRDEIDNMSMNEEELTPKEQKIVDDILKELSESDVNTYLDKIKNYAKKGLLTIAMISSIASGLQAQGIPQNDIDTITQNSIELIQQKDIVDSKSESLLKDNLSKKQFEELKKQAEEVGGYITAAKGTNRNAISSEANFQAKLHTKQGKIKIVDTKTYSVGGKYLYIMIYQVSTLNEAEYRGKDVALNKPKRGGSKKFVVYVKDPKSKNIKKVSFGGTTGLNVKIDEPGARASFAARHNCDQKKDKTKPGYWSCNIGRYWKSLGGSRNFSGYW